VPAVTAEEFRKEVDAIKKDLSTINDQIYDLHKDFEKFATTILQIRYPFAPPRINPNNRYQKVNIKFK